MKSRLAFFLAVMLLLSVCAGIHPAACAGTVEVFKSEDYYYSLQADGSVVVTDYIGKDERVMVPVELDGLPVTRIGVFAFYDNSGLTMISLPDGVISIGNSAFYNCVSLRFISLPDRLTSIGDRCFIGCDSLRNIDLPDTVQSIGEDAFKNCSNLTKLKLPDSVTSIGQEAFSGCDNLTIIVGLDSYGEQYCIDNGINYEYWEYVEVHQSGDYQYRLREDGSASIVEYTGKGGNIRVPSYVDGHPVTGIGDVAFKGCKSLTGIYLPFRLISIGNMAFSDCSNLSSIFFPDRLKSIGVYAFSRCTSLTDISLPDSVTSIDVGSFYECDNLTITVGRDSYARQYCSENGIKYIIPMPTTG